MRLSEYGRFTVRVWAAPGDVLGVPQAYHLVAIYGGNGDVIDLCLVTFSVSVQDGTGTGICRTGICRSLTVAPEASEGEFPLHDLNAHSSFSLCRAEQV